MLEDFHTIRIELSKKVPCGEGLAPSFSAVSYPWEGSGPLLTWSIDPPHPVNRTSWRSALHIMGFTLWA